MDRRERAKRDQRYEDIRQTIREAEASQQPATPSEHGIVSFDELLRSKPVSEVVFYDRASGRAQKRNLVLHTEGARRRIEQQGVKVADANVFSQVETGKSLDPSERPGLVAALNAARQLCIPLVMPCLSRGLRSPEYHQSFNKVARPSVPELEAFLELVQGVTIATLNDPDASPADDDAYLRQLVAEVTGDRIGRPPKQDRVKGHRERRRDRCLRHIPELLKQGLKTSRKIARRLFKDIGELVSHVTVCKWLKMDGAKR